MAFPISLTMPGGGTVDVPTTDAHLLAEHLWRIGTARGVVGADANHLATRVAYALAGDRAVRVETGDLPALALALERLAMSLRITPGLLSLQNAVG